MFPQLRRAAERKEFPACAASSVRRVLIAVVIGGFPDDTLTQAEAAKVRHAKGN
jgi:hypothetical protein